MCQALVGIRLQPVRGRKGHQRLHSSALLPQQQEQKYGKGKVRWLGVCVCVCVCVCEIFLKFSQDSKI